MKTRTHFSLPSATTVLIAAILGISSTAHAMSLGKFGNTELEYKGYVKFDTIVSDYSDGSLAAGNLGRDFYVPSLTPVGGTSESQSTDMHARQTRFAFKTTTDLDSNKIGTYLEFDFMVNPSGNERVSNSYAPRMRHAFLTYNNWLVGQTWSTFMNVGALPETLDFVGSTDATIFIRQSMIRYTHGNFQFAVENPETTVTPFGGGGRIVTDDNAAPDFVARYNYKSDNLSLVVAGLARQLSYDNGDSIDDSTNSYGVSLSGKYQLGKNDLRFVVNTGAGMGRYIGLNVANGAVIDENNKLEAIDSTGWAIAYRHHWNEKWRSNLTYSAIAIDNDTALTGTGVSKSTYSARVNLIYSPTPKLSIGAEFAHAERELETGADGDMDRLQFTAKLAF